ncbi:MAG: glutathionylspermidine synthase family protein [Deltaproteobacteria bacterium]|nr:glutathionylspermidine synthase family protein [Deltaproteobacteria bacterium]
MSAAELWAGEALPPERFEPLRRAAILGHCKWDAQVGDQATLAPFPLVITRSLSDRLSGWAEALDRESRAAERALLETPALWETLAVPRAIRSVLRRGAKEGWSPAAARVMRFDFHPCEDGWRLSEVNADVPGGYGEATEFTQLIAEAHPGLSTTGAPGPAWVDAILASARAHASTQTLFGVLLHAPGFIEDLQVVSYLAKLLRARGAHVTLAQPQHLGWKDGRAHLESDWHRGPLDFVVRFFQAEWLSRLPRSVAWQPLFVGGKTPVANPGLAVLLESKRCPLVWDRLATSLPTWRALLPETRATSGRVGDLDPAWMLKSAYSNNGDDVLHRELTPRAEWQKVTRFLFFSRGEWIEQRRFQPTPLETPWGSMHVCLGVYTVDGQAVGMYGRLSRGPIVDYRAVDVAVLVKETR